MIPLFQKLFGSFTIKNDRVNSPNQKIKGDNNQQIITTNYYEQPTETKKELISISQLRPRDITDEIKEMPLYHQKTAEKAYIGRKVAWQVELIGLENLNANFMLIMYEAEEHNYPLIVGEVAKAAYPELKTAKKGEVFVIKGTIAKVRGLNIDLKNCSIHYKER